MAHSKVDVRLRLRTTARRNLEQSRLGDMSPSFSPYGVRYTTSGNAMLDTQFFLRDPALCILAANLSNLFFCENGVAFALVFTVFLAIFTFHVGHIVGMCAKKQVVRIYALSIVAVMTDVHALWNRAVAQLVTKPMCERHCWLDIESSVIGICFVAHPLPTAVWRIFVDVFPEANARRLAAVVSVNKTNGQSLDPSGCRIGYCSNWRGPTAATFAEFYGRVVRGIIGGHGDLLSRCVKSQAVRAALGQLIAYLHYTPFRQSTQAIGGCA